MRKPDFADRLANEVGTYLVIVIVVIPNVCADMPNMANAKRWRNELIKELAGLNSRPVLFCGSMLGSRKY
ncbi:hypothetical protein Dda_6703 [Drechslerella dactyloides]|uniref:Uncharacterized protein n=1 Tax=Drechslerella dactyloides TaxID=74499 RepID=A0AAD6NHN0_DREDA|nr:hypothetical protein Dda_6703 [Drechslerella dactyloides]